MFSKKYIESFKLLLKQSINKKKMTFGFEIEGIFLESLRNKLGNNWKYKQDGSVNMRDKDMATLLGIDILDTGTEYDLLACNSRGSLFTEINSPVFKNYKTMLSALKAFHYGKNYISNETCGVHIHCGFKTDKISKAKLADINIINKLQEYAGSSLCECVKKRVAGNSFCEKYTIKNFAVDYNNFVNNKKYSFMGNHLSGTLEFRFFASCPHLLDNAKHFFNYLFGLLENYHFMKKTSGYLKDNLQNESKLKIAENIKTELTGKVDWKLNLKSGLDDLIGNPLFENTHNYMSGITTIRSERLKSLTRRYFQLCEGYHNDCECDTCRDLADSGDGCGNDNCENCYPENYDN